ncbi:MAG TPA: hypothetical protein PLN52_23145, partial [Opitutaceae bacterium]|nr:hypothetical protein [Opitutaceae bacterium]
MMRPLTRLKRGSTRANSVENEPCRGGGGNHPSHPSTKVLVLRDVGPLASAVFVLAAVLVLLSMGCRSADTSTQVRMPQFHSSDLVPVRFAGYSVAGGSSQASSFWPKVFVGRADASASLRIVSEVWRELPLDRTQAQWTPPPAPP